MNNTHSPLLLRPVLIGTIAVVVLGCRDRPIPETERSEPTLRDVVSAADDPPTSTIRTIDDAGITRAVQRELTLDHLIPAHTIVVDTEDGIVELTGTVDNLMAQRRAARVAEVIRGVRAVSNRIVVTPKRVPDAELVDDVRTALLYDPETEHYQITVSATGGRVTLGGTVDSWAEKQIAERVAASVAGVGEVHNQLEVRQRERSDAELEGEIERRLAIDVLVDHRRIDVSVRDGVVTLAGEVGSAAERTRAEALAWTAGVESVASEALDVDPRLDDPSLRDHEYVLESESELTEAVRDAMLIDPRVDSFEITPVVRGTTVTLLGTVDNLRAKHAAEQLARNTVGIARVINHIEVQPAVSVRDEQIAEAIRSQLLTNVFTDAFEIQVDVERGVATLTGTVADYFEKAAAGDVASRARGVIAVDNLLQVENTEYGFYSDPYLDWYHPYVATPDTYRPVATKSSDVQLHDEIVAELFWSPAVDSGQVNVRVDAGVATLTGTVDSWRERDAASENAYEGGAIYVVNLLHVDL